MSGRAEVVLTGAEWREVLGVAALPPGWPKRFSGVTEDSRQVRPGWIFVAVSGTQTDGHRFLEDAVRRGAVGLVAGAAAGRGFSCPLVTVENPRTALAALAAARFGHPSRELVVAGVTGTNGKTTVTGYARQLFEGAGHACGLVGTVEYAFGMRRIPARRTTPGPVELQELLRSMREAACTHCMMEVSSHALSQQRVDSLQFAAAVFTNLSQDHLDYHGTMEAYFQAKAQLFAFPELKVRIVGEDAWSDRLAAMYPGEVLRCGLGAGMDVRAALLGVDRDGSTLGVESPWGRGELRLPAVGEHNVRNALQAAALAAGLGVSWAQVLDGLQQVKAAPGRMESIPSAVGRVLVDYAHTPDALANVLRTLRPLVKGRLVVVFGCGGDRDRAKRPQMAAEAARYGDLLLLTQDNPRTEDPNRIFGDMLQGIPDAVSLEVIPDRAAAIHRAVEVMAEADLVLIAGKGHETMQEFAGCKVPFDDREVAREAIRRRNERLVQGEGGHDGI